MSYDISIEFDDGEISDIEMQAWKENYDYGTRAEIQSARLLNKNAKKGDVWDSPKVYQISILNFHYGKDDNTKLSWYTMKDETCKTLSDRQNIIFIDLKTIRKKIGTPINELTPVEKWGLFFSYVDSEKYSDYISELVRSEKGIMAAENTVKYMSEADDNWFVQNSRFIAERDKNTQIHNAEKRGHEKGLQEGLQKGLTQGIQQGIQQGLQQGAQKKAVEAARNFYANGASIELIARSLHMTEEDIREILN